MNRVWLSRRRLCAGLALATLGAAGWARAQTEDHPPADLWRDLDWFDEDRQRPVPVRLYLPPQATQTRRAAATTPLVVFSHGIGGSRRGYSYLGRHFAQHGVASLHLQHVGSDRSLWGGSVLGLPGRLAAAAQDAEAVARVQDLPFALDRLSARAWAERVDTHRKVAGGVRRRLSQHVHRPRRHRRCAAQPAGKGCDPGAVPGLRARRVRCRRRRPACMAAAARRHPVAVPGARGAVGMTPSPAPSPPCSGDRRCVR